MPDTSSSPTHPGLLLRPVEWHLRRCAPAGGVPGLSLKKTFSCSHTTIATQRWGWVHGGGPGGILLPDGQATAMTNLSGHAAPEQQASRASCVCVHGLMTTQLLRAGAMPLLQFVSRHGKASGSSGRRRRALRHAFCSVPIPVDLSRAAKAVPRAPCSQSSCPALRPSCEPSTCWLHCTWSCQFHAQRPACSPPVQHVLHPITINSFEPAPIRAFARRQLELMRKHGLSKREAREQLEQEAEQ